MAIKKKPDPYKKLQKIIDRGCPPKKKLIMGDPNKKLKTTTRGTLTNNEKKNWRGDPYKKNWTGGPLQKKIGQGGP